MHMIIISGRVSFGNRARQEVVYHEKWKYMMGSVSGVLCQKQVSRAGTSNYIPQKLWDVITCPCPWYLLLAQHSWVSMVMETFTTVQLRWAPLDFHWSEDFALLYCEWTMAVVLTFGEAPKLLCCLFHELNQTLYQDKGWPSRVVANLCCVLDESITGSYHDIRWLGSTRYQVIILSFPVLSWIYKMILPPFVLMLSWSQ